MIDQKRYSLDDAVRHIERETKEVYSITALLQDAKNEEIDICFYPTNREIRYIQLDKEYDKKRVLLCEHLPPKDGNNPRYVVIPADNERYLFSSDLINPADDQVFPLISRNALLEFERNTSNKKARVSPFNCTALCEDGSSIEIAIVEGGWVSTKPSLANWLDEKGFPKKYNEGYYHETLSFMEIDRSELCIPAQVLNAYIQRIQEKKEVKVITTDEIEQLDLDTYSLDDALNFFKRNKPQITSKAHIFQKAKNEKLVLSLKFKEAVLTPVSLKQKIDSFNLNPINPDSLNIRGNYLETELAELQKLKDQLITVTDMCLPITEMILDAPEPDREIVTLVEYENQECKPTKSNAVGDYFNSNYIVITKANLHSFLKSTQKQTPLPSQLSESAITSQFEIIRKNKREPGMFMTSAFEAYLKELQISCKREELTTNFDELKKWLLSKKDSNNDVTEVKGYIVRIDNTGFWIDDSIEKKGHFNKTLKRSFDGILAQYNDILTRQ